ncbi:hypothetical protein EIP91_002472 [Steccherinum ochraceum]|uniref:Uncharacterized protein n=1 Tax=Steccherinum ochraceum TaxID=92696 RepID=A0A4V2MWB7_9APHY|nr:hypothetical protein EIP91_002472 [Steccherinum ochraceum]
MESLNLNMLASSLPNSNLANAEKDLMNNFKAAALSLTTLYRSSRRTSKRAYNAGYAAACQDLLLMIQQGVSAGESSSDPNGTGGMTIGRVMDYIEARLEAIKSREDEEDEDEEKERKDKDRSSSIPAQSAPSASTRASTGPSGHSKSSSASRAKDTTPLTPHTPQSFSQPHANHLPFVPSSPTPSTSSVASPLHIPSGSALTARNMKAAKLSALSPNNKDLAPSSLPFTFTNANAATIDALGLSPMPVLPEPVSTGSKRRHAAMLIDSTSPTETISSGPSSSTRRRTRSSRGVAVGGSTGTQDQNMTNRGAEAMEVEEEGRERKRVARR